MQSDLNPASAGVLIVWTDIAAELEDEFNAWYNREHLPDRILRMPGFLRGRRYVARASSAGAPKFLTYYDLEGTAVMLSEAHTALRKHRPARDRLFVPQFRNTIKGICDVVCRTGRGEGGDLVLLPVIADDGRSQAFAQGVCETLLPELAAASGVASALFATRNAAVTQASAAKDDRAGDRYVEALIAVEVTGEAGIAAALARLGTARLAALGGAPQVLTAPAVLRLSYALQAPPLTRS